MTSGGLSANLSLGAAGENQLSISISSSLEIMATETMVSAKQAMRNQLLSLIGHVSPEQRKTESQWICTRVGLVALSAGRKRRSDFQGALFFICVLLFVR